MSAARRFELVEGTSKKFWSVTVEGTAVVTHYGRIGTAGQSTTKDESSSASAEKLAAKLVAEKTKKGYVEVSSGGASPKKAAKKVADAKAGATAAPGPTDAEAAPATFGKRIAAIAATAKAAGVVLPKGADEKAIAKVEKVLGVALPAEARAFYLTHDGGPEGALVLGSRLGLRSLAAIESEWKAWEEASEDFDDEDVEAARGVRKKWWSRGWIPVTYDFGGNHCAIDTTPTKAGKVGQIIEVWHDDGARTLESPDFLTWLEAQTWTPSAAPEVEHGAKGGGPKGAASAAAAEGPRKATDAGPKPTDAGGPDPQVDDAVARALTLGRKGAKEAKDEAAEILDELAPFRPFRSVQRIYPKRLRDELTTSQAKFLEALVELGIERNGVGDGLFDDASHLARFMGRAPAGPSDATIQVDGRHVPLWWAASAVGSGHASSDSVLAAWRKLPAKEGLAAYAEIAAGKAYDVLEARLVSDKPAMGYHCDRYGEAHQKLYRERLVTLLADVSLAFGAEGEAAARALVKSLPAPPKKSATHFVVKGRNIVPAPGAGQALVALLSAVQHAAARKAVVDEAFDAALAHLWARIAHDHFLAPKLVQAIAKGLPKPRAEAFKKAVAEPS